MTTTAEQAKEALVKWLVETRRFEYIHIDLKSLAKLQVKPVIYPKLEEYQQFSSMHQNVA